MRHPVAARKDSRVRQLERAAARPDWASAVPHLPASGAEALATVARTFCPHDWLDETAYRTVVLEIARGASGGGRLAAWLQECLDALQEVGFEQLSEAGQISALERLTNSEAFRLLQRLVVRFLYDDPVVWAGCGYEGVEGCSENGIRAGINDLDWLAEPLLPWAGTAGS